MYYTINGPFKPDDEADEEVQDEALGQAIEQLNLRLKRIVKAAPDEVLSIDDAVAILLDPPKAWPTWSLPFKAYFSKLVEWIWIRADRILMRILNQRLTQKDKETILREALRPYFEIKQRFITYKKNTEEEEEEEEEFYI